MAQQRLAMRKIKEALRLKYDLRLSNRQIARSLKLSPSSVSTYLSLAKSAGLTCPLDSSLSDAQIYQRLFPHKHTTQTQRSLPEWATLHVELKKKGVTLQLLWQEYRSTHPDGLGYSQFCHHYRQFTQALRMSMRQTHKAGEKGFVDYSGATLPLVNSKTGEVTDAQIFVFVLGSSGYTYAEASRSQQLSDWIHSHIRAFEFFGGVPHILVPDNLKSAVTKPSRYEPNINRTYQDMAQHYGTVVIPARVRKPKDKAKAEGGVLLVQRWILAALRHHTFYNLSQANEAIRSLLDRLNAKPMQKLKRSRRELFLELDQPTLLPLPSQGYSFAEFKYARVNIDYHIELDRHYYSVPYPLVGEQVELRFSTQTLEVFHQGKRVASHQRSYRPHQATTVSEHMPKAHQRHAQWTPSRLIQWGNSQGMDIGQLFERIMQSRPHPEQGFRSCLGIMRLAKIYGTQRLNQACQRALTLKTYSYKSIENILKNKLELAPLPQRELPLPLESHENIRGNNYYGDPHDPGRHFKKNESNEIPCDGHIAHRPLKPQ